MIRGSITAVALMMLTGCSGYPLVAPRDLALTPAHAYSYEQVLTIAGVAAAAYWYVDPLAPNWEVNEFELDSDKFRISLRKKRFSTGGDGEAVELFNRHAERIADKRGYEKFVVLSYSERIESETLGARRVARGTIRIEKDLEPVPPEPL
jgi:hypothetical protein